MKNIIIDVDGINNFHNSQPITVRVDGETVDGNGETLYRISAGQAKRIERHFCGISGCRCAAGGVTVQLDSEGATWGLRADMEDDEAPTYSLRADSGVIVQAKSRTLAGAKREASAWMAFGGGSVYVEDETGVICYRRFYKNGNHFGWHEWEGATK